LDGDNSICGECEHNTFGERWVVSKISGKISPYYTSRNLYVFYSFYKFKRCTIYIKIAIKISPSLFKWTAALYI
jgi:hypothetical protein